MGCDNRYDDFSPEEIAAEERLQMARNIRDRLETYPLEKLEKITLSDLLFILRHRLNQLPHYTIRESSEDIARLLEIERKVTRQTKP